jgi:hypothetical protein
MNCAEYCTDYRGIPMGDIDLQREIHLDQYSGIVEYPHEQHSIQKLYSAKIPGQKSSVTVATYQGESAGEVCHIPFLDIQLPDTS